MSLTKNQKKALSKVPTTWVSEGQLSALGINRSTLLSLRSKNVVKMRCDTEGKLFARVTWSFIVIVFFFAGVLLMVE